jgi:hypothetical protein
VTTGDPTRGSRLFYYGTRDDVRLGDRVSIRRWLRGALEGVVCHIPGISPTHPELKRKWAIELADGSLRVMVYSPDEAQPRRKFRLIRRGDAPAAFDPATRLENWEGWENEGSAEG